jgi:hypothetical protein
VIAIPDELIVEHRGQVVALLDNPHLYDMFWFDWRIAPLTRDVDVTSNEYWAATEMESTVLRRKRSRKVAPTALWPTKPIRDGRFMLRGAYVPAGVSFRRQPILWLRLMTGEPLDEETIAKFDSPSNVPTTPA